MGQTHKSFVLIGLLIATLLAGSTCRSTSTPPVDSAKHSYASPFLSNGELAPWASKAIEQGVGLRLRTSEKRSYSAVWVSSEQKKEAEKAARRLGGWKRIHDTSDLAFPSVQALVDSLISQNRQHPRYAEAVSAAMVLYPELMAVFYEH